MTRQKYAVNKDSKVLPTYYPSNLVRWLVETGIDENALFSSTAIDKKRFSSETMRISFKQLEQLLINAMRLTKNENLGLEFGSQLTLTSMGMVGYAALASRTFGEAINTISRYLYLRDPLINADLITTDELAILRFEEPLEYGDIKHFMYTTIFSSFNEIFHFLIDTPYQLTGKLAYSAPITLKQNKTGANPIDLQFESDTNEICFPLSYLNKALKTSDPMTAAAAREICESQLRLNSPLTNIANQVRHTILKQAGSFPKLEEVVNDLCMSPRTLRRKLKLAETSFQSIVDDIRYQLAKKYLLHTQLSVADIAYRLGFSDPSNFGRSFRKWSGNSPSHFRQLPIK